MDVSIIIVNYNTKELTRNCLASIFEKTAGVDFEVIVSDNGSSDGSIEMIRTEFPQVILIENNENLGFGTANNRGLKIAKGKYIFYLNSDTILLNNAVKIFFEYFEKNGEWERVGALGSWLLDEKENIIHSGGDFPTYKNTSHYLFMRVLDSVGIKKIVKRMGLYHENVNSRPKKVDYITGADLFLKNNEMAKFDERFFMYFEESDLQLYMAKKEFSRKIISEAQIVHFVGGSGTEDKMKYDFVKMTALFYWKSCLLYFKKNLSNKEFNTMRRKLLFVYALPHNYFRCKKAFEMLKEIK
ncbi:MAG: glycosyltransferase family 2 protein [Bacteroides sp.]|nr:glycosyltransferase family 2 protein [Prevotella sp.]MCM1407371.1 glycosyltransferase family 2 protein [Treponema brennaborense]MCM1469861.1 glycosyltransferase family 2 protein [Bacteroides sp.]